ncbi:gluconate 2-dehydrogenase gamma chain [Cerasibacillus quisquiliarum]|uniref:Oxidoreductase n=1 Tax=Cerasibacillus quisquiliarum TaxID=227865 RepID=A0A511UZR7_9BACI|nr:gluconate 2-dehydrogenase subunit 3 family protein [Cerasibacillus quisquiliarum]MBB5147291.1 gluconate 2-dehydrogenase gamma chain [Cerasibacillus quisquiliarum]GEN32140.1 oxidoreductase [Cerasibacillus quisquiliarum]
MTEKNTNQASDMKKKQDAQQEVDGLGRRKFIKNTGLVLGGVIGGSLFGGLITNNLKSEPASTDTNEENDGKDARIFFNRKEDFDVLKAAVERIYPEDDNGPGAIWLGVPYFIDRQLAGEFGQNGKDYMQGPFKDIHNTERYQSRLNRGDMMLEGLRAMNQVSLKKHDKRFHEIEGEQQDEILKAFEEGKEKMRGASSKSFFQLLRQMTIEGAYADPLYGGNRDMMGWKMREFPGPRPAYINDIESEEFVKQDPISLKDYQP